jgi:hypothetical protein
MTAKQMTRIKFIAKITKMGEDKRIINIPKHFFNEIQKFGNKQLKVTLDDEI